MSENTPDVKTPEPKKPLVFKCRFCGEVKPLNEFTMIRHYYPHMSACKSCALGNVAHLENKPAEEQPAEEQPAAEQPAAE